MNELQAELSTATGLFFSRTASSVEVHTEHGSIRITPDEESHLHMIQASEIVIQTPEGFWIFQLKNAVAGLKGRTFTVLAESIHRVEPEPIP